MGYMYIYLLMRGRRDRDRMVFGFTTTYMQSVHIWNIVESGVKHHQTNKPFNETVCFALKYFKWNIKENKSKITTKKSNPLIISPFTFTVTSVLYQCFSFYWSTDCCSDIAWIKAVMTIDSDHSCYVVESLIFALETSSEYENKFKT